MIYSHINRKNSDEYGFTLIELLVVILIIGVLAAIAIPAFLNQKRKAELAEGKSDLRNTALIYEYQTGARHNNVPFSSTNSNINFKNSLIEANLLSDYNGPNRAKTMAMCSSPTDAVFVFWPGWAKTVSANTQEHTFVTYSATQGAQEKTAVIPRDNGNVYLLNDICQYVYPGYTYAQWSQTLS